MPMPPYHWVICRHMRTPRPLASMSASTVEPVQENPETASNRALSHSDRVNIEPST